MWLGIWKATLFYLLVIDQRYLSSTQWKILPPPWMSKFLTMMAHFRRLSHLDMLKWISWSKALVICQTFGFHYLAGTHGLMHQGCIYEYFWPIPKSQIHFLNTLSVWRRKLELRCSFSLPIIPLVVCEVALRSRDLGSIYSQLLLQLEGGCNWPFWSAMPF